PDPRGPPAGPGGPPGPGLAAADGGAPGRGGLTVVRGRLVCRLGGAGHVDLGGAHGSITSLRCRCWSKTDSPPTASIACRFSSVATRSSCTEAVSSCSSQANESSTAVVRIASTRAAVYPGEEI